MSMNIFLSKKYFFYVKTKLICFANYVVSTENRAILLKDVYLSSIILICDIHFCFILKNIEPYQTELNVVAQT